MKTMILKDMLAKEQLLVPCIYDCASAKMAENTGYQAVMLSGASISYAMDGLPDMAMATIDELVFAAEHITNCVKIPLLIDGDDGYGESPAVVYRNVKRLIQAGSQAITIEDSTGVRGFERRIAAKNTPGADPFKDSLVSKEVWLAKIRAGAEACEGTDCMIIARTNCYPVLGLDEAIDRCAKAREMGAQMTLICSGGLKHVEDARIAAERDKGWKVWPDIVSENGVPNITLEEVEPYGFNMVTCHVFEKGAIYGMMRRGKHNREEAHKGKCEKE
ncbi:MAG: isocitrate lyase/PEP mutase family protein [Lachnospiraceae bacterium]|nr:isocitrate lyase/PEP mutase family protein [Lachnospiraceae bacterium]